MQTFAYDLHAMFGKWIFSIDMENGQPYSYP